jgi:hypothetical protein
MDYRSFNFYSCNSALLLVLTFCANLSFHPFAYIAFCLIDYGKHKGQNKHLEDSDKHKFEGDIVCMKSLSKNQLLQKLDASTGKQINLGKPRQTSGMREERRNYH